MSTHDDHCLPNADPLASDEFARGAAFWPVDPDGSGRRTFLKRMSAALALAGITSAGCSDRPKGEKLVPYVNAPEGMIPGKAMAFATTMPLNGYGRGVIALSREGRPIKIEGNVDHPSSLGGTDVFMQASILDLYDPCRTQSPLRAGLPSDWTTFDASLNERLARLRPIGGEGLHVLSGTVTSPTLAAQLEVFRQQFPKARWHHFDPLAAENATAASIAAFGRPLTPIYDLKKAKTIVAIDGDFLFELPGSVRYAREFIDGRRVRAERMEMNRLYVAESTLSLAGSMADHRLPLKPSEIEPLARSLAAACGVREVSSNATSAPATPDHQRWVRAVADDLLAHRGACIVIVGDAQPPVVHALAYAMNQALGNVGQTVRFVTSQEVGAGDASLTLAALVEDMKADRVDTLLIVADNPAYAAPADVPFGDALASMSTARAADGSFRHFTAHLGLRANDTAFRCQWHLPETHYLEQWGDVRAHDGTASLIQPLIAPMFRGRSVYEVLDVVLAGDGRGGYEIVRDYWRGEIKAPDFESAWNDALKRGVVPSTTPPAVDAGPPTPASFAPSSKPATSSSSDALEIVFRPDPSVWDGSFAWNSWLQELPHHFTKLVWDNAALISPATAKTHNLVHGDVIKLTVEARSIEVPVAILPGVPDGTATLHLGYGLPVDRGDDGEAKNVGVSVYPLRDSTMRGFATGATLSKLDRQHKLVVTRNHHAMADLEEDVGIISRESLKPRAVVTSDSPPDEREASKNRRLVRLATLSAFQSNPDIIKELGGEGEKKPLLSLYPEWDYSKGYQWGMSIDQTACIGCNACVVACQAENNIPVVGKDQVDRGREMHWLRIDDYFHGKDAENPQVTHQPVPCMHCETAPCEVVCPVGATTHSVEGLNQMTYNRCVGTRYCSNNCPYKVRRFNFLDYTSKLRDSTTKLQQNPEVTVRARGVMEKCSYCVQRLQRTRIEAERVVLDLKEQARKAATPADVSRLQDEAARQEFDLLDRLDTACAQACPTRAITFGSILPVGGKKTRLMDEKRQPHDYTLLRELTTKPRTSYLGRITNANPAMSAVEGGAT